MKMNGLSDVRLTLHSQELVAGQGNGAQRRHAQRAVRPESLGSVLASSAHAQGVAEADAEQLKDVGLTREQAREEGLKPFWRI
jgi:uncharacterized protein YaiL (DUF2058 family)